MKVAVLIVGLFTLASATSYTCNQMRSRVTKRAQCEPAETFEGKLTPCYDLCKWNKVPGPGECGTGRYTHCCVHNCSCVMKGAGTDEGEIPVEHLRPEPKKKASAPALELIEGCIPDPPPTEEPAKPYLPTEKPRPSKKPRPSRTPRAKPQTKAPEPKTPAKPSRRPRTRKTTPEPTTKPTPRTRKTTPEPRRTPKPKPSKKPVRTKGPKPGTRKPRPSPTPKKPRRTTTTTTEKPRRVTSKKPRRPLSKKPRRPTTTEDPCTTTQSSFSIGFGNMFSRILGGFGFNVSPTSNDC